MEWLQTSIQAHPLVFLGMIGFVLGSLPLIEWATYGLSGQRLSQIGTGNVSVSAAFAHGGTTVGVVAVLLEMFRGIAVVLLARSLFPNEPAWELIALIPLIAGRYLIHRGAGVTNVVWGYFVHDWRVAFFTGLLGGIIFTILRAKATSRWLVLALTVLITVLLHPYNTAELTACLLLCLVIAMIYSQIPDDLDLADSSVKPESRRMLGFFRGDRAFPSLKQPLKVSDVGEKSATLSQLKSWGYPVPMGWVIQPGDDPESLVQSLQLSGDCPVIVRSSAIGEDSEDSSAAGQYESFGNITTPCALRQAILQCQQSYSRASAVKYRRDRNLPDTGMAVLVQRQIKGVFSGVAFSRDPITRQGDAVVIEALPGDASQVVSGRLTPEQYQVFIPTEGIEFDTDNDQRARWKIPDEQTFPINGDGNIPPRLIQHVAYLVRHLEHRYHGIPQDMEWSYDGQSLWVLQSRPITTLLPLWTRKIAAEVIPGHLHPLTWSINRPLTCGVWGDIFSLVLGKQADEFDFQQTATLHNSVAYFNASLLGQIFRCMGLPEESLEFLTRGAKLKRPSLLITLKQLPGLWRLVRREWSLERDFEGDCPHLTTALQTLSKDDLHSLSEQELWHRASQIQDLLKIATYYNIMAPLSAAARQAIFRVPDAAIDRQQLPEVASIKALQVLAQDIAQDVAQEVAQDITKNTTQDTAQNSNAFESVQSWDDLHEMLEKITDGMEGRDRLDHRLGDFLDTYGYLSDVATDIAVPTWKEDPRPVQGLLLQYLKHPPIVPASASPNSAQSCSPKVQSRIELKGHVAELYNRLLAELRWTFIALESNWLQKGRLAEPGDIFFLKTDEIQSAPADVSALIQTRRSQLQEHQNQPASYLVYGNGPLQPSGILPTASAASGGEDQTQYQGIGASPGQILGRVVILSSLSEQANLSPGDILVVPYTDAGWAPLLTQASGIIAEAGGRLSHGAIIAREYGIPAVMDIPYITQYLQSGQVVELDGTTGSVTVIRDTLGSDQ
ncbi:MAG: glycerol-3-phosphate acyltransferase [Cyanobacteria bacterium P01_F01_bin.150]